MDGYFQSEEEKKSVASALPNQVLEFPRAIYRHPMRRCSRVVRIKSMIRGTMIRGKLTTFKVYKLDQELGKWVEETNVGDEALFLSDDVCFAVSTAEFDGCKRNCIYFNDRVDGCLFSYAKDASFFNLEDGSIDNYTWPAPICFTNKYLNTKLWIVNFSNNNPPTEWFNSKIEQGTEVTCTCFLGFLASYKSSNDHTNVWMLLNNGVLGAFIVICGTIYV